MQRTIKNISAFALLFALTALLGGCQKDDDNNGSSNGSPTPASGQWKVTSLISKSGDETSKYAGYVFDFAGNGALTASNGSQTWTGTWATNVDDSKNKFVIDFTGTVPSALAELEEDWLILEMTAGGMHFEHVSGGNGGTETLKFGKL